MLLNKQGAALLQVLIVTAILAGMSAMILRMSLSRTITSRQTRHVITAQSVIEACMAEVNMIWAAKTPEAYARDLAACQMCQPGVDTNCSSGEGSKKHTCNVAISSQHPSAYSVEANMASSSGGSTTPPCQITYTITNDTNDARQTL